jgi:hypothetical protein
VGSGHALVDLETDYIGKFKVAQGLKTLKTYTALLRDR